jgi:hypothetical protein
VGALRKRAAEQPAAAAPEPAPEAEPEAAAPVAARDPKADAGPLDVDDVIVAWASVLPELPVATRSAVQEAQPLTVEEDVVTFGVSPRLIEAARPRFRREADTIRDALSKHVGRSLRFNLVAHEGFAGERGSSPAPAAPPPTEPDEVVGEPDDVAAELEDAGPGVESSSPTNLLAESLGATVVEERQHD